MSERCAFQIFSIFRNRISCTDLRRNLFKIFYSWFLTSTGALLDTEPMRPPQPPIVFFSSLKEAFFSRFPHFWSCSTVALTTACPPALSKSYLLLIRIFRNFFSRPFSPLFFFLLLLLPPTPPPHQTHQTAAADAHFLPTIMLVWVFLDPSFLPSSSAGGRPSTKGRPRGSLPPPESKRPRPKAKTPSLTLRPSVRPSDSPPFAGRKKKARSLNSCTVTSRRFFRVFSWRKKKLRKQSPATKYCNVGCLGSRWVKVAPNCSPYDQGKKGPLYLWGSFPLFYFRHKVFYIVGFPQFLIFCVPS